MSLAPEVEEAFYPEMEALEGVSVHVVGNSKVCVSRYGSICLHSTASSSAPVLSTDPEELLKQLVLKTNLELTVVCQNIVEKVGWERGTGVSWMDSVGHSPLGIASFFCQK